VENVSNHSNMDIGGQDKTPISVSLWGLVSLAGV